MKKILFLLFLVSCTPIVEEIPNGEKYYVGETLDCMRMKYDCPEDYIHFFDDTGCGCTINKEILTDNPQVIPEETTIVCQPKQRTEECLDLYNPVCGYFNPEEVQCTKEPCAITYSSSCSACSNELVVYYIPGNCPV